ncbi:SulP family inorganic anion transporter [Paraburkholderia rhizosphaerae]|uniref:High affinity sulfate transporter 1 n=1 Tax=Paraburkholderia rhizosphaerae TaxID=480658 RepID=A0A4V3HEY6_9BURK|nr:SulP family inorganic anion transporter [Paraburkholderia rhizosphaerae]TDY50861.1 high affinity sulfate transporter 1 [Paraburkholderia rhizosphaerae]
MPPSVPPRRPSRPNALLVPEWLRHYRSHWVKGDVIAGLTAAAVVIPNALAYATLAGLPVEAGLYTAFIPMVIYALLGTSRVLSVSTTTTLAILTTSALARVAPGGGQAELLAAAATLGVLVGAMLMVGSLLRLGFVANFISAPVLVGFKAGIAVVIFVDQLPKLLGIHFVKGEFFYNLLRIAEGLPRSSTPTLIVAALALVTLIVLRRFVPRVPAPLVVVAVAIVVSKLLDLHAHGVETVGAVPAGLPAPRLPVLALADTLWPIALGMALMSFTETVAAGRAFAHHGEPAPRANRELFATGLANLVGALFGAMPGGGGTTQTAVNRRAGARSQAASLVTAAVALAAMLLLSPLIALIPQAVLAAVVIVYSIGLFDPIEFRAIARVRRMEFLWAIVALGGVVVVGTLQGIVVAIIVSLAALAHQVSDPPVYVLARKRNTDVFRPVSDAHPNDETWPGLLLLLPEGRIYFANVEQIGQKILRLIAAAAPQTVIVDLSGVFDIEYTALKMFIDAEQRLRARGITLWLAALNPEVLALVQRTPLGETLGRERMFHNLEQAVDHYRTAVLGEASDMGRAR